MSDKLDSLRLNDDDAGWLTEDSEQEHHEEHSPPTQHVSDTKPPHPQTRQEPPSETKIQSKPTQWADEGVEDADWSRGRECEKPLGTRPQPYKEHSHEAKGSLHANQTTTQEGRRAATKDSCSEPLAPADEPEKPPKDCRRQLASSAHNETEEVVEGILGTIQNVSVKLADKQADVNSPLYSVKTFEELGLSEELLKGIYAMKFVRPSKVQERALPLLLSDPPQNMIGQSQSGTGKTAAFVLTMLKRIDTSRPHTQAICLAPTRELARQIVDVIRKMGQFTTITIENCLREEGLRRDTVSAHIIVGTPGTLLDLERRRLVDLRGVRVFVLDEADVMLDKQGMGVQSMRLRKLCPENAQLLLFSATFNESVIEFAHAIIPNANEITLKREDVAVDSIKQFYIECHSYAEKIETLSTIYGLLTIGQSIIFVATRATADEISDRMTQEGHLVSVLHGGLAPEERDRVIDEFRDGKTKVLISTNVLARGIDVLQVSLVVNFDLPLTADRLPDPETYVHRIGRTGRFGRSGVAINFVHNRQSMETLLALEKFFARPIHRMPTESIEILEQKLQSISRSGH